MSFHSTCRDPKGQRLLCPRCLFWDPRPEDAAGPGMGYCEKRDIVTKIRCECEFFEEATPTKVEARNRAIYGVIPGEEEEE